MARGGGVGSLVRLWGIEGPSGHCSRASAQHLAPWPAVQPRLDLIAERGLGFTHTGVIPQSHTCRIPWELPHFGHLPSFLVFLGGRTWLGARSLIPAVCFSEFILIHLHVAAVLCPATLQVPTNLGLFLHDPHLSNCPMCALSIICLSREAKGGGTCWVPLHRVRSWWASWARARGHTYDSAAVSQEAYGPQERLCLQLVLCYVHGGYCSGLSGVAEAFYQ